MFTVLGCNTLQHKTPGTPGDIDNPPVESPKAPVETTEPDPVKGLVDKMSLEEKIGQMIIAGVDSYTNDEHSRTLINKYHVGGFIILGQNVKDTKQLVALSNSLKQTNALQSKIPLFLGIDQEGGRISRMPGDFTAIPTAKVIGEVNNPNFSLQIGKLLGQQVKSFGLNLDFAPVLDVNSNPKNPVIGDRAYGSDPQTVSRLAIQTMRGIESQNIIPVVKHFPGHGDTSVDSHVGLPTVNNDLRRLMSFELIPFSEAIKNNVEAVMVAHILLPKIDPNNPASMSKAIITDLLRNKLGFTGIVITDDMTMGAIVKNFDIGKAAVKSVAAGTDIVLVCHDYDKEQAVITALKQAVLNGDLTEKQIDQSVYKILQLKQKYKLTDDSVTGVDVKTINQNINNILNKYLKK